MGKKYNDKLDANEQITVEEWIASKLFDTNKLTEGECQKLSQRILLEVLRNFRPDFFGPNHYRLKAGD